MAFASANINVMVRAVQRAGRGLVRDFGEVEKLQVSEKGPSDFVSRADTQAEKVLREELAKARPKYGFLLEESGEIPGADTSNRWIVDPLDGTTNFLHGIAHFAISVALERDGEVVAGVVYNPVTDETFWAEKSAGAFLMDQRLRVSARRLMSDAVIATGIPHRGRGNHRAYLPELAAVMQEVAGVRRFGAAALDLAFVAAGRVDGFWEHGLAPWDTAAGLLLVREAGGYVTDFDGGTDILAKGNVVAANQRLHQPLLQLLRKTHNT